MTASNAAGRKDTGDDQTMEEVVRGIVDDIKMRRLCNMGMLVRRLEMALKVIDDSRALNEPAKRELNDHGACA